jgi:hypothetical protein
MAATKMGALTIGDPMDDKIDIGPLATESGRNVPASCPNWGCANS